tara:strand:+ start:2549 stop:3346 length:798 start_codon:yes stop_codon:yes gene_type:complete
MKKFLVVGNPINHSLSPKLHNYWIHQNKLKAVYEKKQVEEEKIKEIIREIKEEKISGINVTVPFKQSVIPFLSVLTPVAKKTNSVNTVYKKENQIIGDNTDVIGFKSAVKFINFDVKYKKALVLGAGGVTPSIILALEEMGASEITLSNRTQEKAESLRKNFNKLKLISWGKTVEADIIINTTSLGLNREDKIKIDYNKIGSNKLFYDLIYNPTQTKFLSEAKKVNNQTENGKIMFIYQAQQAFKIWHNIEPKIDDNLIKLLDND